ncbi:MAG: beta-1,6-N-acetylglucosaminyltransferase [Mucilaginibacter sp.]
MRIAHLILVHAYPKMLERLVSRLRYAEADIYIQLDAKADIKQFESLQYNCNVVFVENRVKTEWGNYSIVEATLAGFKHILNTQIPYSHINLLSGQDYPLRPIAEFHAFLAENSDRSFMHSLSLAGDEWEDGKDRLVKYSLGDYGFKGRYILQAIVNRILPPRKVPEGIMPYGRSQWITITPECARYVISYIATNPRVKKYLRMTWAVDELFFQTILMNSPLKDKLINNNLRYIEQFGANRPVIFTAGDLEKLRASGKFFARKFDDEIDTEIYDLLDAEIGFRKHEVF